jgi:hypothetical protein
MDWRSNQHTLAPQVMEEVMKLQRFCFDLAQAKISGREYVVTTSHMTAVLSIKPSHQVTFGGLNFLLLELRAALKFFVRIDYATSEGFLFDVQWKAGTRSNGCNDSALG